MVLRKAPPTRRTDEARGRVEDLPDRALLAYVILDHPARLAAINELERRAGGKWCEPVPHHTDEEIIRDPHGRL